MELLLLYISICINCITIILNNAYFELVVNFERLHLCDFLDNLLLVSYPFMVPMTL